MPKGNLKRRIHIPRLAGTRRLSSLPALLPRIHVRERLARGAQPRIERSITLDSTQGRPVENGQSSVKTWECRRTARSRRRRSVDDGRTGRLTKQGRRLVIDQGGLPECPSPRCVTVTVTAVSPLAPRRRRCQSPSRLCEKTPAASNVTLASGSVPPPPRST